jgi:DNA-binding NarL/FixJ family response regulator
MSTSSHVVMLCSDLMMTSSVSGAASHAGRPFSSIAGVQDLGACNDDDLILIDLGLPGLDIEKAAAQLNDQQKKNAVVYGPHVHKARFEAAQTAGFSNVIPRGQFAANISALIGQTSHGE